MKQILLTLKDGVIVGASMLLPGISGGTMAIILGIYDTLIRSISSLRKNLKKSLLVLIPFCIGAGLGIVLLSKWVLEAVNLFPVPMHYLFIGVIIGSIPALYQKANIRKFHPSFCTVFDRRDMADRIAGHLGRQYHRAADTINPSRRLLQQPYAGRKLQHGIRRGNNQSKLCGNSRNHNNPEYYSLGHPV